MGDGVIDLQMVRVNLESANERVRAAGYKSDYRYLSLSTTATGTGPLAVQAWVYSFYLKNDPGHDVVKVDAADGRTWAPSAGETDSRELPT